LSQRQAGAALSIAARQSTCMRWAPISPKTTPTATPPQMPRPPCQISNARYQTPPVSACQLVITL